MASDNVKDQESEDDRSNQKEEDDSIFRNWSANDSRLLAITFVATVAANLVTVILVGLAIVLARSYYAPTGREPARHSYMLWHFGFLLFGTLGGAMLVSLVLGVLRHKSDERRIAPELRVIYKIVTWALAALGVFVGCMSIMYALVWVGLAAGVK